MHLITGKNVAQISTPSARQPVLYGTRQPYNPQPLAALRATLNLGWRKRRRMTATACIGTTVIIIMNRHKSYLTEQKDILTGFIITE
jgi:hypothetical protein